MAIKRTAKAHWTGNGKEGKGELTTQSGILTGTRYGYNSRFEDGPGTNPEELIGAAHAGCFSMALAFAMQGASITPESIDTSATVVLDNGTITEILLDTKVKAAGVSQEQFTELANGAKANCPVSKLLNAKITFTAELV